MDMSILAQLTETASSTTEFVMNLDLHKFGAIIGGGLAVWGAAKGIGNIGGKAVEAIARQPEAGGRIFTSMIVSAALIEGFTFFALVVVLLAIL